MTAQKEPMYLISESEPIELKCWSVSFQAIKNGSKRFEFRKDDRPYAVGKTLHQREWNPDTLYTGDCLYHDITWLIRGGVFGIPDGYVIMSMTEPRNTRFHPLPAPAPRLDKFLYKLLNKWKQTMKGDTWLTEMEAIPLTDIEYDIAQVLSTTLENAPAPEQEQYRKGWNDALEKVGQKTEDAKRKNSDKCIEARKQGYACGTKRTILISTVEGWIAELRKVKP